MWGAAGATKPLAGGCGERAGAGAPAAGAFAARQRRAAAPAGGQEPCPLSWCTRTARPGGRAGAVANGHGAAARRGGSGGTGARRGGLARARATPFTPDNWDRVQPRLFAAKPVISSAEQALDAAQAGQAVVVDVRPADDYGKVHVPGAVSCPYFKPLESWDVKSVLKRAVYAVNGIKGGSEPNPEFLDLVQAVAAGAEGKTLLFMCDAGGYYEPLPGFLKGKPSRSLQACDTAMTSGLVSGVTLGHVEGGLREWGKQGLPLEGSDPDFWVEKASALP